MGCREVFGCRHHLGVMREGCVASSVTPLAVHGPRHQHRGDTSSQGWGWTASDSSRQPSQGLNHHRKQPLPGCWGSQSCLLHPCMGTYSRCAPTELAVGFLEKPGSSGAPKASPKDQICTTSLSWKREKTQYAASSNDRHVAHTGRCQKMLTSALPAAPCLLPWPCREEHPSDLPFGAFCFVGQLSPTAKPSAGAARRELCPSSPLQVTGTSISHCSCTGEVPRLSLGVLMPEGT